MSRVETDVASLIAHWMGERNVASTSFFDREAERLADISARMAERFERGGRLIALGFGSAASDAQHIAVEFVHPVLVGKRALPALDLSCAVESVPALVRSSDIVVGFNPEDSRVTAALQQARSLGAFTLALPGGANGLSVPAPSSNAFVCQEVIEVLYHALWETVHVFLERSVVEAGSAAASFLYPFLSESRPATDSVISEVAASIRAKAATLERLRTQVAQEQSAAIANAVAAIHERVVSGGTVFCLGNGGSATDALDFAHDLSSPPKGLGAIPAISLASDAGTLTALANDVGVEAMFARQLMAHGRRGDIAVTISTSGTSRNIAAALAAARAAGLVTVALVGYDGGDVLRHQLADHTIVVNSDQIPRIQEVHASIYHVMVALLHALRRSHD